MNRAVSGNASRLGCYKGAAVALAVVLSVPVYATDLLEVYRLAQDSDPIIASARYTLDSVRQKIPQARAGLLPVLSATGKEGDTRANSEFTGITPVERNMKSWNWNWQLTQPLIRFGNVAAYRESQFVVEQAEAQYAQAQQDLLLRVAQAYFGVIVAQDAIAAAAAQVVALEEQLAQVSRGYELGTHSVTDIDDTKSRLGSARSQRVAAQNDMESAKAELEKVAGKTFDQLAALQTTMSPPQPSPLNSRTWMDQARINHPMVRAQRAALEAARQEIKKNRSDHLPTLDFVANYGSNFSSHSLTTPSDFSTRIKQQEASVQFTLPFYAGGAVNSRVTEAIANMNKAEADLEAASRKASTDAQQAFAGVTNGLAQIDALNVAVEAGQSAVKGNRVGYRLGIRINIDVLNAEQQLFTAQRDLSKARYDTLLQGFKLKAAVGTLDEKDLFAVNAMLR